MATGKVKWFDAKKGFGFIEQDGEEGDIFLHYTNLNGEGFRTINAGERVTFELGDGPKGKQALNVSKLIGEKTDAVGSPQSEDS